MSCFCKWAILDVCSRRTVGVIVAKSGHGFEPFFLWGSRDDLG